MMPNDHPARRRIRRTFIRTTSSARRSHSFGRRDPAPSSRASIASLEGGKQQAVTPNQLCALASALSVTAAHLLQESADTRFEAMALAAARERRQAKR